MDWTDVVKQICFIVLLFTGVVNFNILYRVEGCGQLAINVNYARISKEAYFTSQS
jgi:hypothetical protein